MARRTISYPDHIDEWLVTQIENDEFDGYSDAFQQAIIALRDEYESDHTNEYEQAHTGLDSNYEIDVNLSRVAETVDAIADEVGVDLAVRRRDDRLEELAESWDQQGDADLKLRKEILRSLWNYLREHESAQSRELWEHVWAEYQNDVTWSTKQSAWSWLQPRLKELPHVDHRGGKTYRFDTEYR